jgi:hypothetical protein
MTTTINYFSLTTETTTTAQTMSQGVALLVAKQLTDLARKAAKK